MITTLFRYIQQWLPALEEWLMRCWYWYISRADTAQEVTFMNYGYAYKQPISLPADQEGNRYPIQLYHYITSSTDLQNKRVLEVGCGRGGGAAYVYHNFHPKQLTGLDLSNEAIRFCQQYYAEEPHLQFQQGDALQLSHYFDASSFDIVINIESSHRYAEISTFLTEVKYVLSSGGYFLWSDFRESSEFAELKQCIAESDFQWIKEQDITTEVVAALNRDTPRRTRLINKLTPAPLRHPAHEFAGTKGTQLYQSFIKRDKYYFNYILQSP